MRTEYHRRRLNNGTKETASFRLSPCPPGFPANSDTPQPTGWCAGDAGKTHRPGRRSSHSTVSECDPTRSLKAKLPLHDFSADIKAAPKPSSIDATMASVSRRVLLALLSLLLPAVLSAPAATFPGDKAALAALRSAVAASSVPPYSCLASWDFARDPCAAFPCGLRCYAAAGATNSSYLRVTAVALDPAGYSGALPAALLS